MSDSALFMSGSLFTTDYLVEAIAATPAYLAVDVADLRANLDDIADKFPKNARTNESQTEDDFIWPVLAALGWSESLRQQNLTVAGRDDVPDGLLFEDAAAKAAANAQDDQYRRYSYGLPPYAWDEERRLMLRAKLDALYFILYGVFDPTDAAASRDDIRYIYSTFPIVAEKETEKWGSYRSQELCLAWINALIAGQPDAEIGN